MALLSGMSNIIRETLPANGSENVDLVHKPIEIYFSFDMVPDTINSSTLLLFDEGANKIPCSVLYGAKRATITPIDVTEVTKKARYQVLIKGGELGIRSILDHTLNSDYVFNFITNDTLAVGKAGLLSPLDRSVLRPPASFSWEEVSSGEDISYELQVSKESKFGSLSYSTNLIETSISPDFNFEHDEIYYWRVLALKAGDPGVWSDTWQFRYSILSEEEERAQETLSSPVYQAFDILEVYPKPDFVSVNTGSTIKIKFNNNLDELTIDNSSVTVYIEDLNGIGEPTNIFGSINVVEDTIEFLPSSPLVENAIYTVEISKNIRSVEGILLDDDISWVFSTVFSPYYSSINAVRSEIGSFISGISDMDIAREILDVSRWADQIGAKPYGQKNDDYLGDTQSKTTNNIFYHNYTKYETSIRLLNRRVVEHVEYHGQRRVIGDLEVKSSGSMTPDINIALKRLETLRNRAEKYLTMGRQTYPLPKPAVKGERYYPYSLNKRNSF